MHYLVCESYTCNPTLPAFDAAVLKAASEMPTMTSSKMSPLAYLEPRWLEQRFTHTPHLPVTRRRKLDSWELVFACQVCGHQRVYGREAVDTAVHGAVNA